MDAKRFDSLAKAFSAAGTRRGLLGVLAALPLAGSFMALLDDETDAAGRRKRRKKRHKHQQGDGKDHRKGQRKGKDKGKKKCKPASTDQTCAGKCATVTNNCGAQVDCGACTCAVGCPACQTCNPATGLCVNAPNRTVCGGSGSTTSVCCNGSCCTGCCGGSDDSCGSCLVFLTSSTHTGSLGGLSGADVICQTRATEASRPGTYKAWLSTVGVGGASPSTRFRQSAQPYRLVNGTQVAANWADLIVPPIDAKINVTEAGTMFPDSPMQYAWTDTLATGSPGGQNANGHCLNWTSASSSQRGNVGQSNATNFQWTAFAESPCNSAEVAGAGRRLFCFQQD